MFNMDYCKGDSNGVNQGRGCWWRSPAFNAHGNKQCRFCGTAKCEPKQQVVATLPPITPRAGGF